MLINTPLSVHTFPSGFYLSQNSTNHFPVNQYYSKAVAAHSQQLSEEHCIQVFKLLLKSTVHLLQAFSCCTNGNEVLCVTPEPDGHTHMKLVKPEDSFLKRVALAIKEKSSYRNGRAYHKHTSTGLYRLAHNCPAFGSLCLQCQNLSACTARHTVCPTATTLCAQHGRA